MKKIDKHLIYDGIDFSLEKDSSCILGLYIAFHRDHHQELGKATKVWVVSEGLDLSGVAPLGQVRWFARWRKYGFFPAPNTVFEEACLRQIAYFCESATKFHKEKKKAIGISLHATE